MKQIQFTQSNIDYMIYCYENKIKTLKELAIEFNCSIDTIRRRIKKGNNIKKKQNFKYQDLTGNIYDHLLVIKEDKIRYQNDLLKTNKPYRYWICECDCGNILSVESSHLKTNHTTSCGHIKSKGEQKIQKLLKDNNILFEKEYSFDNLKGYGKRKLRFDFTIFNNFHQLQYLIEYNGQQHYQKTGGWCTDEEFFIRKVNDNMKIKYCRDNKIPLIIIPYTHYNKLQINDLIIYTTKYLFYEKENDILWGCGIKK